MDVYRYALVDFGLAQDAPVKLHKANVGRPPLVKGYSRSESQKENVGGALLLAVSTVFLPGIVCSRFMQVKVGCLTSQQHASVSQGLICSDNFTCCHTEIEVADQTFYLTQSQYTDTGPTSPSADPITPGAWQGSHWSANF